MIQQGRKIRVVLTGCGGMSNEWLKSAKKLPDVEMVGLVDIVEEAARKRAQEHQLQDVVIGTDLAQVLEQTQPDAVFNCTIPQAHYQVTLEALKHQCHILNEKPMADSMEHAREMVAAAQASGKIVAVIQNRRYTAHIRRLKHFLQSGALGPLTTINSDFYIGAHFGGFRDHMAHVLLLDMAIHTFDAARFLIGADPVAVYCKEWNPEGSWYDRDASALAIFEMSNGSIYTYRGSWCANGYFTSWEGDWRLIGTQGSVLWDGNAGMKAEVVAETGGFFSNYQQQEIPEVETEAYAHGHFSQIREFITAIQNRTTPETICSDNIKSLAMVFGAIESAESGKRVEISL